MPPILLQFFRFGVVGTLGFLLDYAVLGAAVALGTGPYWGRVISYVVAATGVYALNRAWTFRDRRGGGGIGRQWGLYLALNLVGFAVNYGTYAAITAWTEIGARHLVLGVAAGSIAGMFVNFALNRQVVFRAR
ncbi:GtrA family protein [Roseococcus thiosulfatophilus]|uniref:GtrA family protein n=1 Tax=Roseococcus thiosulfatophilus TaxID=35813 RepID=UPI001A8D088E|nr:GtrA family protein [Roseococcus thiosulfatophilus]